MAFEVSFNSDNKFFRLSNSDANKSAINTQSNLTWKTITETDFQEIIDGKKTVTGFTGDTVNYFQDDNSPSDTFYTYKTALESYVKSLKEKHNAFLAGNSTDLNSALNTSLTALNNLNLDTIVTWVDDSEGNPRVEKNCASQIVREANSNIIHLVQIP